MLHHIKDLYRDTLAAIDGDIGRVKDWYFDDQTWMIRYLVADTGTWLPGRLVLLAPQALGKMEPFEKTLHVKLTKKQIKNCPPIESHLPVSRQHEIEYYRYYGWPAYWETDATWGLGVSPVLLPQPVAPPRRRSDRHLQSTRAVNGYLIRATDGAIGTVSGFMVDDRNWEIRELVAETGHWYDGRQILISPSKVREIDYGDSLIRVDLTKAEIQNKAEHDPVHSEADKSVAAE